MFPAANEELEEAVCEANETKPEPAVDAVDSIFSVETLEMLEDIDNPPTPDVEV